MTIFKILTSSIVWKLEENLTEARQKGFFFFRFSPFSSSLIFLLLLSISFYLFIWLHPGLTCTIWGLHSDIWGLVPWPWFQPGPSVLRVRSLSCWTTRKSLFISYLMIPPLKQFWADLLSCRNWLPYSLKRFCGINAL